MKLIKCSLVLVKLIGMIFVAEGSRPEFVEAILEDVRMTVNGGSAVKGDGEAGYLNPDLVGGSEKFVIAPNAKMTRFRIKMEAVEEGEELLLRWGGLKLFIVFEGGALSFRTEEGDAKIPTEFYLGTDRIENWTTLDFMHFRKGRVNHYVGFLNGSVFFDVEQVSNKEPGNENLELYSTSVAKVWYEAVKHSEGIPDFGLRALKRRNVSESDMKLALSLTEGRLEKVEYSTWLPQEEREKVGYPEFMQNVRKGELSLNEEAWYLTRSANRTVYEIYPGVELEEVVFLENAFESRVQDYLPGLISRSWRKPWRQEDIGDGFAQKIYGYLVPDVSGEYVFWVSGDDQGRFYLGDASSDEVELLASFDSATGPMNWKLYSSQKSGAVYLNAGEPYYFEAWHLDKGGPDSFSVAWTLPEESGFEPSELLPAHLVSSYSGGVPGTFPRIISIPDPSHLPDQELIPDLGQEKIVETAISDSYSDWLRADMAIIPEDFGTAGASRFHAHDPVGGYTNNGLGWVWGDADDWSVTGTSLYAFNLQPYEGWVWYADDTSNPQYFYRFDTGQWFAFYPNPNRMIYLQSENIPARFDFEAGYSGWSHSNEGSHDWTKDVGGTPSSGTGPSVDNTKKDVFGNYMYLETSQAFNNGNDAHFLSPRFHFTSGTMGIGFYYHMYGYDMGTLYLDVSVDGVWQNNIWSRTGQQHTSNGAGFSLATVSLGSSYRNKLLRFRLRGVASGNYRGDMAFDDFFVYKVGADTDGDGILDSVELANGGDPFNADGLMDGDKDLISLYSEKRSGSFGINGWGDESTWASNGGIQWEAFTLYGGSLVLVVPEGAYSVNKPNLIINKLSN